MSRIMIVILIYHRHKLIEPDLRLHPKARPNKKSLKCCYLNNISRRFPTELCNVMTASCNLKKAKVYITQHFIYFACSYITITPALTEIFSRLLRFLYKEEPIYCHTQDGARNSTFHWFSISCNTDLSFVLGTWVILFQKRMKTVQSSLWGFMYPLQHVHKTGASIFEQITRSIPEDRSKLHNEELHKYSHNWLK
jgi:hypothetical protein